MHTKVPGFDYELPSSLSRYGIAFLSVMLAAVIALVLHRSGYPDHFALFYVAVLASAWFGGLSPSLFATALSVSAIVSIFHPIFSLSGVGPYNSVRLVLFALISFVVSWLGEARLRSDIAHRAVAQHYRQLFDRNLAGVFLSTLDGQVLDCNESFARILGYDSPKDVMTHPASDFYLDKSHRDSYIEQLQRDGGVTDFEMCVKARDGRPVWLIENVTLIEDEFGARTVLQGTIVDVTVRKRKEDDLRKQKELLQAVFDHAPVMMSFYGEDGRVITVNREWERTRGWSQEEIEKQNMDVLTETYPDPLCRQRVRDFMTEATGAWADFKTPVRDGRVIDTTWAVVSLSDGTRACFGQDITKKKRAEEARRESEQRYQQIVETACEGIWQIDAENHTTFVNQRMAEMVGYTVDEMQGASLFEFMDEEGKKIAATNVERRRNGISEQHDFKFRRKNGSDLWAIVSTDPILDSTGRYDGALGMVTDVTERRLAEEALRESEERYHDLIEHSREMICAHDLDGWVISANRAVAEAMGYDSNEPLKGKNIRNALAPEVRNEFEQYMATLLEVGATQGIMLVETRTGERRLWEYYNSLRADGVTTPIVRAMARDVTDRKRAEALLAGEKRVLEMVASGRQLPDILDALTRELEKQSRDLSCSILLLDADGEHLRHGAAPSLPDTYCQAIDGLRIGPNVGSCGTAAFRKELVVVENIATDPLWRDFRDLALKHGLVACWSTPILSADGKVLGTFAMYYREPRRPGPVDLELIDRATQLAAIAIGRRQAEQALISSEQRYRDIFTLAPVGIYQSLRNGTLVTANRTLAEMLEYDSVEEFLRVSLADVYSTPDEREKLIREFENRGYASDLELLWKKKDGSPIWVQLTAHAIKRTDSITKYFEGFVRDVSERKRTEIALQTFPRRLIAAQEGERRRVARELHDEIGQTLTAIRINLQSVQRSSDEGIISAQLVGSIKTVDLAIQQVRELALDLRPSLLDDLGLVAALRWYLDREATRAELTMEMKLHLKGTRLAPEIETACFRIAQESLTNIVRHAQAKRVKVELALRDADLQLVISDDGVGFDVRAAQHRFAADTCLGLQGMQERVLTVGGTIEIESSKAKGTEVRVHFPLIPSLSTRSEG